MKYTVEYLLNAHYSLNQIDIKDHNPVTIYLVGRNIRKLEPIAKKFEEDRQEVLKDAWFKEYQELSEKESKEVADKKFEDELKEADKEIKELLEKEVDFTFYTRKIDDVSFTGMDVVKYMDIIGE